MRWGYRHERCSKFQRTIQTPVVVIRVIHTAAHIYTKSEILLNIRDMPAGGCAFGGATRMEVLTVVGASRLSGTVWDHSCRAFSSPTSE